MIWKPLLTLAVALAVAGTSFAAETPLSQPTIFDPQVIQDADSAPTFSPDGNTLLYARSGANNDTIVESHLTGGAWSGPVTVSFSGKWNDMDPIFSPDGSYVVFASGRPIEGRPPSAAQLWRVNRTADGWSEPSPLSPEVNDGAMLVAPSIANDGTIYYLHITKSRAHQLFRAKLQNGAYLRGQALSFSDPVYKDYDPEIAPDQSFVIFASSGRRSPPDKNRHLFIAFARGEEWGPVLPIRYQGDVPSSDDAGPILSRDGATLFFVSDRGGKSNAWTLPIGDFLRSRQPG